MKIYHQTEFGKILHGDALEVLDTEIEPGSVDLMMTSPPFGLVRKKQKKHLKFLENTGILKYYTNSTYTKHDLKKRESSYGLDDSSS
jgi:site-specific DNA-methyltransferase (cytosine-N4-specific)